MPKGATARATAVTLVTTAETTVLSGIPAAGGNSASCIDQTIVGVINVLAGTGTTAIVVKCKQSGGTQIGVSQTDTLAAGGSENIPFCFQDTSGANNTSYLLTVTQTGATGNGTVNDVSAYAVGEG